MQTTATARPTTRALALRSSDTCGQCQEVPARLTHAQPALIRHAGYGATTRVTVDVCACRTRLVAMASEQ